VEVLAALTCLPASGSFPAAVGAGGRGFLQLLVGGPEAVRVVGEVVFPAKGEGEEVSVEVRAAEDGSLSLEVRGQGGLVLGSLLVPASA